MAEGAHDPAQAAMHLGPTDTGITAALTALLMHMIMPASGNVRRTGGGWPRLDPYRIGHPSQSGWPSYLVYGLLVALAVGLLSGGAHWLAGRPGRLHHKS